MPHEADEDIMIINHQGTLAPIAVNQLQYWQAFAYQWPGYIDDRQWRCSTCDQAIYTIADENYAPYQLLESEILALKVAHIRQRHAEDYNAAH